MNMKFSQTLSVKKLLVISSEMGGNGTHQLEKTGSKRQNITQIT